MEKTKIYFPIVDWEKEGKNLFSIFIFVPLVIVIILTISLLLGNLFVEKISFDLGVFIILNVVLVFTGIIFFFYIVNAIYSIVLYNKPTIQKTRSGDAYLVKHSLSYPYHYHASSKEITIGCQTYSKIWWDSLADNKEMFERLQDSLGTSISHKRLKKEYYIFLRTLGSI